MFGIPDGLTTRIFGLGQLIEEPLRHALRIAECTIAARMAFGWSGPIAAAGMVIFDCPPGTIYEYRRSLLELAPVHHKDRFAVEVGQFPPLGSAWNPA